MPDGGGRHPGRVQDGPLGLASREALAARGDIIERDALVPWLTAVAGPAGAVSRLLLASGGLATGREARER